MTITLTPDKEEKRYHLYKDILENGKVTKMMLSKLNLEIKTKFGNLVATVHEVSSKPLILSPYFPPLTSLYTCF